MPKQKDREPMVELFIYETNQLIDQLEQVILDSEKSEDLSTSIDEIFRVMHTIKGSAGMMMLDSISTLAHSIEDVFFSIREGKTIDKNKLPGLFDIVLECLDFFKLEIDKLDQNKEVNGNPQNLIDSINDFIEDLDGIEIKDKKSIETDKKDKKFYIPAANNTKRGTKHYQVTIFFDYDCGMENIRAFTVIHQLKDLVTIISHNPQDIINDDSSSNIIKEEGLIIVFESNKDKEELNNFFSKVQFLREYEFIILEEEKEIKSNILRDKNGINKHEEKYKQVPISNKTQQMISVNVKKLDQLMDLVGELVISEAMVTQHPELKDIELDDYYKAARHLNKISNELQDIVMSIRMVPLSMTFSKMNRIVRDMCKKLDKKIDLNIIGEETEVDKNIIEHIGDPLMHLIRNAIDHGIESKEDRKRVSKNEIGNITLEAKNEGGYVWIIVKDDGKGLDKEKILKKAKENNLIYKPESELTDRNIYSFIFSPGFSTKKQITEFSGRGVGMDVVAKNIESVGGTVFVDSELGKGTTVFIKIPLTLAIIDGMNVTVGNSLFTIPITSIKESFKINKQDIVFSDNDEEMIKIRGGFYSVLRLHKLYGIKPKNDNLEDGIIIMVESEEQLICLFVDKLIGEQQVVVKALPNYLKKVKGLAGCTLLGNGDISLILDIPTLVNTF